MYRIRSEAELQQVLAQGQGFLINKWSGNIKVHDLQHLPDLCRGSLGYSLYYQKYFASIASMSKRLTPYPGSTTCLISCEDKYYRESHYEK